MIHIESVQEVHDIFPKTLLDRLPPIITETEMETFLSLNTLEHLVDGFVCPTFILRMTCKVGFIDLHNRRINSFNLPTQHLGEIHG